MRILSVDDNTDNLYLIESIMGKVDHQVVSARNGAEALEHLDGHLPDLIISDILMPEMDGFQLCHEVKSHERTRHIPFIFYTATYTAKKDEELALSLGASRFLIKPVDPVQFMEVIQQVCAAAQRGDIAAPKIEPVSSVDYLKAYNSRLVSKLDRKIEQLEASRQALRVSLAARDQEIIQRHLAEEERSKMEAQFLHAQKLESVGRLAGGIAHDFNNLLTVINIHSELFLRELSENHPMRRGMQEIRTAGERAAILTKQLLAFSRRQVIDAKPLNLSKAVDDVRGMVQSLVGDNIEVVTKLTSTGRVIMDEGQLHQVLLNLIVNSRDAMPRGGRLVIETSNVNADVPQLAGDNDVQTGSCVLLSVSDTGTGMAREIQDRIFEPFFTTKVEGEGTGLGLSTVYGIVQQSGGWIRVESQPGAGSTFRIWLPEYISGESLHSVSDVSEESAVRLGETALQMKTVLVVEDYATVRDIIVMILKRQGYQVLEAESGQEALAIADQHVDAIDLLLSDVQMPRMDGPELARQMKARLPNLRVLFASAHPAGGWSDAILVAPGIGWISKPFTPEALAIKVRELLEVPLANGVTKASGNS